MSDVNSKMAVRDDGNKKRSKRILTPARKEQNRVAQRAYRQRQKELRMAKKVQRSEIPTLHPKPIPLSANSRQQGPRNSSSDAKLLPPDLDPIHGEAGWSQESSCSLLMADPSRHHLIPECFLLDDIAPIQTNHRFTDPAIHVGLPDIWNPLDPNHSQELDASTSTHITNSSVLSSDVSDTFMQIPPPNYESISNTSTLLSNPAQIKRAQTEASTSDSLPPVRNQTVNEVVNYESGESSRLDTVPSLHTRHHHVPAIYEESTPRLADPYQNAIQFSNIAIIQICALNAYCLGLSPEHFISADCLSLCSPFYKRAKASDDPKALLASVSKPLAPKSLQPTLSQILFPHHPMFDLIPLPGFREKAIMLSSTSPPILDPLELKRDIMQGGLICWGARHGPSHTGSGQPWDIRSWEAAPWFLKKWQLLVGGKDGELWRQSMWWRNLRGEPLIEQ